MAKPVDQRSLNRYFWASPILSGCFPNERGSAVEEFYSAVFTPA